MPIEFSCPECGRAYCVKDEWAGKKATCLCGEVFIVPEEMEETIAFDDSRSEIGLKSSWPDEEEILNSLDLPRVEAPTPRSTSPLQTRNQSIQKPPWDQHGSVRYPYFKMNLFHRFMLIASIATIFLFMFCINNDRLLDFGEFRGGGKKMFVDSGLYPFLLVVSWCGIAHLCYLGFRCKTDRDTRNLYGPPEQSLLKNISRLNGGWAEPSKYELEADYRRKIEERHPGMGYPLQNIDWNDLPDSILGPMTEKHPEILGYLDRVPELPFERDPESCYGDSPLALKPLGPGEQPTPMDTTWLPEDIVSERLGNTCSGPYHGCDERGVGILRKEYMYDERGYPVIRPEYIPVLKAFRARHFHVPDPRVTAPRDPRIRQSRFELKVVGSSSPDPGQAEHHSQDVDEINWMLQEAAESETPLINGVNERKGEKY